MSNAVTEVKSFFEELGSCSCSSLCGWLSWSPIARLFGPLTSFDDNLQHSNNHLSKSSTFSVFLTTCLMSLAILCCCSSSIDGHLSAKYCVPNVILPRLFFLTVLGLGCPPAAFLAMPSSLQPSEAVLWLWLTTRCVWDVLQRPSLRFCQTCSL